LSWYQTAWSWRRRQCGPSEHPRRLETTTFFNCSISRHWTP
jgi:hypothetical protein